jgi:hypothetical protein
MTLATRSREDQAPPIAPNPAKRKITLASGLLRTMAPLEDELDEDLGEQAPAA